MAFSKAFCMATRIGTTSRLARVSSKCPYQQDEEDIVDDDFFDSEDSSDEEEEEDVRPRV